MTRSTLPPVQKAKKGSSIADLPPDPLAQPKTPAEQSLLHKRAVDLFTFLRELVSLRTTVVRNLSSYDRVLWMEEVPKEAECECVVYRKPAEDEDNDWWLRVRKPNFIEAPIPPKGLTEWADPDTLGDSAQESPRPLDQIEVAGAGGQKRVVKLADYPQVMAEWNKWVADKWHAWAVDDRRKRKVLHVYTELFSLYQLQKELGEAYEVIIAMGQLRWQPRPGVEVNRHLVAVQTSIEFDSQKGVILVGPAAEGGKPRLEEDMLELDERPAPDVLTGLEVQVAGCDDEVWHNPQMTGALKSFVHSLGSGGGTYSDDLTPVGKSGPEPVVHFAPAIIVRRRTEQGLLQVYGRILEDLKKRTDVPPGLIPLIEVGWQAKEAGAIKDLEAKTPAPRSEELLFPLHFNDEQKEIVQRLAIQSGVVVQGPPGTGKSHTIANLVCHLLATGHRVLVTSHAPRALRILKDKIPQAITNMCVVLLGNDRTAMTELEGSVELITQQLHTWNPAVRNAAIKEVEDHLATLRGRASEIDKALRAIRESDTFKHPPMPGGYQGTLQNIAKALRAQQGKYGWITACAQGLEGELAADPGITNAEAVDLLSGLRLVDAAKRKDLERDLPQQTEAVPPQKMEEIFSEEKHWHQTAESARIAVEQPDVAVPPTLPLPRDMEADHAVLTELSDLMERILRQNSELESHRFSWGPRLSRDIRAMQYEHWRLLLEQTRPKLAAIKEQPDTVYELEVIHQGEVDPSTFRDDVATLVKHVEAGGKLKSMFGYVSPAKERKYILTSVEIGGKRIKGLEMLKQLLAWAEVQYQLKALEQLWSDVQEAPLGAIVRRMPVWFERCALIEMAHQMHLSIERAREILAKLPVTRTVHWDDTDELKLLSKQLKVMCAHKEYQARKASVDAMAEKAGRKSGSSTHAVVTKLAQSIKKRDLQAYTQAHAQIAELWAEREKWARSSTLLKKLAERLPKAAAAVSESAADSAWDERMARLNEAWLWLKADRWLKQQLDPRHFEYLQTERKSLQEHLQAALVKLAAEKAWFHCMNRMTPIEETYLKAWVQAIKNIGAGTGKRATRFRKVARQTLDRCRSAIPSWIMPIHRVAETVSPGEDRFDVVIVDEASQSGAEALFLHYIAKKIIIVGDDKQIAPYNVGIDRDDVELLRSRHIPDLPLTDYFDLDHSFFDQAYLRFGNRIRLCEHFRCMPEIIQFSNKLCYENEPLLPLRRYGDGRLEPVVVAKHVANAHMDGTSPTVVNKAEADAIVKTIAKLVADPHYREKTFGVISMLGEKQARLIEQKLLTSIGPEEMERRRLICGDAYSFQGDERNVMMISLVVSADEGRRMATLTQPADERRFNVAASRARDQMWLFHSVMPDDLSAKCLRRQLLEYCLNPQVPQEAGADLTVGDLEAHAASVDRTRVPAPPPFESWLEVDVYLQIRNRGFRVLPQHAFAGYKIDLVVTGTSGRLAVECNGEEWLGQEHYDSDMTRQRQLERCGWRFWRIRGGTFYRNPELALVPLWDLLEKQGIRPQDEDTAIPTKPSNGKNGKGAAKEHAAESAASAEPEKATKKRGTKNGTRKAG